MEESHHHYRLIEHPADIGFEVEADDFAELFQRAGMALAAIMWRAASGAASERRQVFIEAGDRVELLVNFLEEFLYLQDARDMLVTDVAILDLGDSHLRADLALRPIDPERDELLLGVKAITYHQIQVDRKPDGRCLGRVFLDI